MYSYEYKYVMFVRRVVMLYTSGACELGRSHEYGSGGTIFIAKITRKIDKIT